MKIVWHYTISRCLAGILADGAINPAVEGLAAPELSPEAIGLRDNVSLLQILFYNPDVPWVTSRRDDLFTHYANTSIGNTVSNRFETFNDWAQIDRPTHAQLEAILASGKPAYVQVPIGERPAVWFSSRPTWEPTATKGVIDSRTGRRRTATAAEMLRAGLVRIGVDASGLSTWLEHRQTGGISKADARQLVVAAKQVGANPGDWYVHYGPVAIQWWVRVQRWEADRWVDGVATERSALPVQQGG
jgi:hypothetical protein